MNALGNAIRLFVTGEQANDYPLAIPLLAGIEADQVIADTACDSDENRVYCAGKGIEVVIPNRPDCTKPAPFDEAQYEDCNKIERFFNRMKRFRQLATRYEKNEDFLSGFLACSSCLRLAPVIVLTPYFRKLFRKWEGYAAVGW